jgi:hypothetical protein
VLSMSREALAMLDGLVREDDGPTEALGRMRSRWVRELVYREWSRRRGPQSRPDHHARREEKSRG